MRRTILRCRFPIATFGGPARHPASAWRQRPLGQKDYQMTDKLNTNVPQVKYDKGIVTVSFPLVPNGDYEPSKGAKASPMVASTRGFMPIPGTTASLSLNCILPPKA